MDQATDNLARWRNNIYPIPQLVQNDVSSTKVRLFFRRGLSVRFLIPAAIIEYIKQNGLYHISLDDGSNLEKGKEKEIGDAETSH